MKRKSLSEHNAKELTKAWKWAIKKLGLQAWTLTLILQPDPPTDWGVDIDPRAIGNTCAFLTHKEARVWVSIERSLESKESPLSTLFHELVHVALHEGAMLHESITPTEFIVNRLSYLIETAYLWETQ